MNVNDQMEAFVKAVAKDKRTLEMFRYLVNSAYIRVVNYHNTNAWDAKRIEQEIAYYSRHFVPVTLKDMDQFFETGRWPYEKPGLIPAVFEGYRSHFDIMRPILDKYHFTGWFYIPSFFSEVEVAEQVKFCRSHRLRVTCEPMYPDGRVTMNKEEIRILSQIHEICCHTGNHFEITKETSDEDMYREIVLAGKKLESYIERPVQVFCWLAGEEYHYNPKTHRYLEMAGYKYVVSNLKIEKIK